MHFEPIGSNREIQLDSPDSAILSNCCYQIDTHFTHFNYLLLLFQSMFILFYHFQYLFSYIFRFNTPTVANSFIIHWTKPGRHPKQIDSLLVVRRYLQIVILDVIAVQSSQ